MDGSASRSNNPELSSRLRTLVIVRVIFVSLMLGAAVAVQLNTSKQFYEAGQPYHYLLIAAVYLLSPIYLLVLRHIRQAGRLRWFAYLQLILDTLFVTGIVYTTGGIDSIFSFLYMLTIIGASILLYRRGGMIIASCCSILYGTLLDFHYFGILQPLGSRSLDPAAYHNLHVFYLILVNIIGFYLVAYLTSYLAEQTRKSRAEVQAKQVDIDNLEILNESIINSINSGLIALDESTRVILFNPAAEAIFGIQASRVSGKTVDQALPFIRDRLREFIAPGTAKVKRPPPFADLAYTRPDGEERYLRLTVSPLRLNRGEQKGHILVFQDVTEIKQIESEMKKVESLALTGQLAAGIAHEVRNPMASISGSIQMLKDGLSENDLNNRLMDIINREINRLNNLVNDFLSFAKPKKTEYQPFDLNQLILESLELFKNSRYWDNRISLKTDLQQAVTVESDPEQVKQILWNLLLNASEAMTQGGELHVSTNSNSGSNGKRAKIVVRDTGKGFDQAALSHLFTPFYTTKEQGSGLGLATVKRITEGLKGEIHGTNHPEGGAQLTLILPLHPTSPDETHLDA